MAKTKYQKETEQMYEDLMALAHNLEDRLEYPKKFGEIVNQLQDYKIGEELNNNQKIGQSTII